MTELSAQERYAMALRVKQTRQTVEPTREEYLRSLETASDEALERTIEELEAAAEEERAAELEALEGREREAQAQEAQQVERRRQAFRDEIRSIVAEILEEHESTEQEKG